MATPIENLQNSISKTVHDILKEDTNFLDRWIVEHVVDHISMATIKALIAHYGSQASKYMEPFMTTAESIFKPEVFSHIKLFKQVVDTPIDTKAGMRARDRVSNEPITL